MRPAGVITTDLEIKAAQIEDTRQRWNERPASMNAGGVPILTHGLKFQPISISTEDAQIIDQLKLNDRTIAAVFGVPAILLGITDTATQKSAEAVMAEWLASGLGLLINHIEVAFDKFVGLNADSVGRGANGPNSIPARCCARCSRNGSRAWRAACRAASMRRTRRAPRRAWRGCQTARREPRVQQQMVPLDFDAAGTGTAAGADRAAEPPAEADEPTRARRRRAHGADRVPSATRDDHVRAA